MGDRGRMLRKERGQCRGVGRDRDIGDGCTLMKATYVDKTLTKESTHMESP